MDQAKPASGDAEESARHALAFEIRFGALIDQTAHNLERELRSLSQHLRSTR